MGRVALIVVGMSIGILLGIVGFEVLDDDRPRPVVGPGEPPAIAFPPVEHDPGAAEELASAWRRWRTSTHYARGTWSRHLDAGGPPLRGPVLSVQDPPRRLTVRLGSLVELIDSTTRACDADIDGALPPGCTLAEGALGYTERVELELATISGYVSGDPRPFDIGYGAEPGCFRAENRALLPAAPWGLWAEFCFDPDSGAMARVRIRRDTAVDTEIMFEIRATVADADFEVG